jgi:hypothetical protein
MIKWLFSWCGKEKRVVSFSEENLYSPPPQQPPKYALRTLPREEIPYDIQTKACANMDNLHRAVCSVDGAQMHVKVRRKTKTFVYVDEMQLRASLEPKTEVIRLAAYDEDAFWSLAHLCHCKIGAMERWLLQL